MDRDAAFAADPFGALEVIAQELDACPDPVDPDAAKEWGDELVAARMRLSDYPWWKARAWRLTGEIAERLNRPAGALEAYVRAVDLHPHIGVRRRIAALGGTVAPAPLRAPNAEPSVDDRPYSSEFCPSCGLRLRPLPKAKKACPGCGEPIHVRGGPDGRRHLLRADQLAENSAWWARGQADRDRERQRAAEERRAAAVAADRAAGLLVGDYRPRVAEESLHLPTLRFLVGDKARGVVRVEFVAELVRKRNIGREPTSVDVVVDGRKVGDLAGEDAERVASMLQRLEQSRPCRCRITIIGRFDDHHSGYSVHILGIPSPR